MSGAVTRPMPERRPAMSVATDPGALASLGHEIRTLAKEYSAVTDDYRLQVARRLATAKAYCKRSGRAFNDWCARELRDDQGRRLLSYHECVRLAKIGASDDPPKAIADLRASGAKRNRKSRAAKVASRDTTRPTTTLESLTRDWEVLSRTEQLKFLAAIDQDGVAGQLREAEARAREAENQLMQIEDFHELQEEAAELQQEIEELTEQRDDLYDAIDEREGKTLLFSVLLDEDGETELLPHLAEDDPEEHYAAAGLLAGRIFEDKLYKLKRGKRP